MTRRPAYRKALKDQFNKCAYCEKQMVLEYGSGASITWDHVVAKSRGGKEKVGVCYTCNIKKGSRPLMEFLKKDLYPNDPPKAREIFNRISDSLKRDRVLFHSDNTPIDRVVLGYNTAYHFGRRLGGYTVRAGNSVTQLPLFKGM
jgi:hypothetical protein